MALVSPGVTVREVDVSYVIPPGINFEVINDTTIKIHNWQWWDSGREYDIGSIAGRVHKWLDENTELGADECCVREYIRFNRPEELTAFVLKWS